MSNNVIIFPKENKNIKKMITVEEINHSVEMMNQYHIQETIQNLVPLIFNQLEIAGFIFSSDELEDESLVDGAFIVESIRSWMCKYYEIHHPFQVIAQNVFTPEDQNGEMIYKIVDTLNINLKDEDDEIRED